MKMIELSIEEFNYNSGQNVQQRIMINIDNIVSLSCVDYHVIVEPCLYEKIARTPTKNNPNDFAYVQSKTTPTKLIHCTQIILKGNTIQVFKSIDELKEMIKNA